MDLRQLLRESPASRMAISTRSLDIALSAWAIIKFGTRDPSGVASGANVHGTCGAWSVSGIPNKSRPRAQTQCPENSAHLRWVADRPGHHGICSCVSIKALGDFDIACDECATRLEEKRSTSGDEGLTAAILLGLELLQVKTDHSLKDLYTSLCVAENQAQIPVSVLCRLWQLDEDAVIDIVHLFRDMSLAVLRQGSESFREFGIVLHDLQLDFCRHYAAKYNKTSLWHAQLLNGYLAASSEPRAEELNAFTTDALVSFEPRPWWSLTVSEDVYIYENLWRHLTCAGLSIELAALLLDGRWTEVRGRIGGLLALKSDFELLEKGFLRIENSMERQSIAEETRKGFRDIFKAVQLSWGRRIVTGLRVFQFYAGGRLASVRKSNVIIETYLSSVEKFTPKPCLVPVNSFFPELNSALTLEIPRWRGCAVVLQLALWALHCS